MNAFKLMAVALLQAHGDTCAYCPLNKDDSRCSRTVCGPDKYECQCDGCKVARAELA